MLGKAEGKRRKEQQRMRYQLNRHEFAQTLGAGETGKPGVLQAVGSPKVRHN